MVEQAFVALMLFWSEIAHSGGMECVWGVEKFIEAIGNSRSPDESLAGLPSKAGPVAIRSATGLG